MTKEDTMITPASIGDWALLAGALAAVSAFAVAGYRWVLADGRTDTHGTLETAFDAPARPGVNARV